MNATDKAATDKAGRVAEVFTSVAGRYDLMNDVMSLGSHRLLKRLAANATRARPGQRLLDLAGGTGDLAALLAPKVGAEGEVVLADINAAMLGRGRRRLEDRGHIGNIRYALADAEALPFADGSFHAISIAFGLRNVSRLEAALASMLRVLKPGGRLVVLEFSRPPNARFRQLFEGYSSLWPLAGRLIADDGDSYQYLLDSIKAHPDQERLAEMMRDAGYAKVRFENLLGGVTALHEGRRAA